MMEQSKLYFQTHQPSPLTLPLRLCFSTFRFWHLFYSIPLSFLLLYAGIKLSDYAAQTLQVSLPTWLYGISYCLYLVFIAALVIKTFFLLNVRKMRVDIDREGFIIHDKKEKKIYWSHIKSYVFPKDKYESRANAPSSTVILSFGFMRILVISCSTWTLFDKEQRRLQQADFAQFKLAIAQFCTPL